MKLKYIHISSFKNLQEFSFEFETNATDLVTVILGRNGAGKSNLLEALVVIFRDLYLGRQSEFSYELHYTLGSSESELITIKNDLKGKEFVFQVQSKGSVKNQLISLAKLRTELGQRWLPRHVFAYYSGPSDRLEEHFREHQRKFYRDLLDGKDRPFRPLFYARPVHSQFVLLSFFTTNDIMSAEFLKKHFHIESLDSALFVLHEPSWAKGSIKKSSDPRFWGARGVVAGFLSRLYEASLAPLRLKTRILQKGSDRPKEMDMLYLFLKDEQALHTLANEHSTPAGLFKELESTYISDLIHEVRIRVRIRNSDGSLTFRELSEGEQQLLTVVGLLRFTKENESLFLLDEPDTHLNPEWGMQYLNILREVAEPGIDSHILMATHDPLVLSGLTKEQVVVMERDIVTGKVIAEMPEIDPQGLGVVGILRSSMFGLRTTLDFPTQEKLDRRFNLVAKGESRTPGETSELQSLSDELATLGFANEFRDSNYDEYAKALGRVRLNDRVSLSKEEILSLEKEAEEIVRNLEEKGGS